ncbi:lysozyme [Stenotrophomonas sp. 24(2023)]|uniref:lysozyme n=1 Tax=Stenotrophomonas sp. 24(2023) TaxID=3068324 RepID=UPI0027E1F67A|nr:lysozyme [Stenotrophomonas sp. 24(2023)]WMJ71050.1 lysozyme [Stenotrophomonas sp. 24(2023)]
MNAMTLSPQGIDWLKQVEGQRLQPYDDQNGKAIDHWVTGATVGYGHLIAREEWATLGRGVTLAEAEQLLRKDLAPFEQTVNRSVKASLAQHQFDALVILCFNIGGGNFGRSSVLKLVNDPHVATPYANLQAAWMAWTRSQGKVMKGLVNRRGAEWRMYSNGSYDHW